MAFERVEVFSFLVFFFFYNSLSLAFINNKKTRKYYVISDVNVEKN